MSSRHSALVFAILSLITTCSGPETAGESEQDSYFNPVASIRAIMSGMIVPAANGVWGAVAVRSTANGLEEVAPETDEEWETVRNEALQLVEAANLLMMKGRIVTGPEHPLLDANLEGNMTAEQINAKIEIDWDLFVSFAQAFQSAALVSLAAIDAHDTRRLSDSVVGLNEACENCHTTFWYPKAP